MNNRYTLRTMHTILALLVSLLIVSNCYSEVRGQPQETTPTMATATSVEVAAADPNRTYLLIQNNTSANICCSLSNKTLTGIVPSATNICFVLAPAGSYESNSLYVPVSAVTCYQSSGVSTNAVFVAQGYK